MTLPLIDKQDTFEIVRDQIAAVLATEINSQQALALDAGKNPDLWKVRIFVEATNPWEQFLEGDPVERSPLANIWYDTSSFQPGQSNIVERQKAEVIYNIDCYALGVSQVDGSGHKPGDRESAFEVSRALRLVRNILMAGEYTYLGIRGTVHRRWVESVTVYQPQLDDQALQNVRAARLAFRVEFNELAPQVTGEALELASVKVTRSGTGEILISADYDYTA